MDLTRYHCGIRSIAGSVRLASGLGDGIITKILRVITAVGGNQNLKFVEVLDYAGRQEGTHAQMVHLGGGVDRLAGILVGTCEQCRDLTSLTIRLRLRKLNQDPV